MQWYEKHRPKDWADFVGQSKAIRRIRALVQAPDFDRGTFMLHGPSGSGKTSMALALCHTLGMGDMDIYEAKGCEANIALVKWVEKDILHATLFGNGWRAFLFEEAHNMTRAAQEALLHVTERMPARRVIIFTTTKPDCFEPSLWSRFWTIKLGPPKADEAAAILANICQSEGYSPPAKNLKYMVNQYRGNLRAAIQELEAECKERKEG